MSVKTRLFPREKLRIFLEDLRIKEKALFGALEALKNSGKKKDPEKNRLKKEIE